jgi:hypothetical protein
MAGPEEFMRRTVATLLITGLLSVSTPMMVRDHGGRDGCGDFTRFVRIIKSIIHHLILAPADDGNILPPKP